MAQPRVHLSRAPIEEAVIEFRARPREGLTLQDLTPLRDELAREYPISAEVFTAELLMGVQRGEQFSSQSQSIRGWLLRSRDNHYAIRLSLDSFSFSQLRPYTHWEEVVGMGFPLWQRYAAAAKPAEIARVGVRFINKLEVARAPLSNYLEAPPTAPAASPKEIAHFLSRVEVRDVERSCSATITQASGVAPPPDRIVLLVDIDAYREGSWPPTALNAAWLEPLRALKNELFFAALTEALVSKYE